LREVAISLRCPNNLILVIERVILFFSFLSELSSVYTLSLAWLCIQVYLLPLRLLRGVSFEIRFHFLLLLGLISHFISFNFFDSLSCGCLLRFLFAPHLFRLSVERVLYLFNFIQRLT